VPVASSSDLSDVDANGGHLFRTSADVAHGFEAFQEPLPRLGALQAGLLLSRSRVGTLAALNPLHREPDGSMQAVADTPASADDEVHAVV
jgi:hypothetical protein